MAGTPGLPIWCLPVLALVAAATATATVGAGLVLLGLIGTSIALFSAPAPGEAPLPMLLVIPRVEESGSPAPPATVDGGETVRPEETSASPGEVQTGPQAEIRALVQALRGSGELSTARPLAEPATIPYRELFQAVAAQHGHDWRLLAALAYRESRLDPLALGRDQDMGLMQIVPATWYEFAPPMGATDPFAAWESVHVAAAYLTYLQAFLAERGVHDVAWVLVAYNWGPDNVRRLLEAGGNWADVPLRQQRYAAEILHTAFGSNAGE